LATEDEKLIFSATLGLKRDCLFTAISVAYPDGQCASGTSRTDFPYSSRARQSILNRWFHCATWTGASKALRFVTYLEHHHDLFSRLSSFEVVYIAIDQQMFPKADAYLHDASEHHRAFAKTPTPMALETVHEFESVLASGREWIFANARWCSKHRANMRSALGNIC